jgi:hypothetical protein
VPAKFLETHARIDEFLPDYDFRSVYQIRINAIRSVVYECLVESDFTDLRLTRLLMTLRNGKRMPRLDNRHRNLLQRFDGTSVVILEEVPSDEIVIGVAGKFWRPDGGRCMDLRAADFINFSRSGFAKAAWNFMLRADLGRVNTIVGPRRSGRS